MGFTPGDDYESDQQCDHFFGVIPASLKGVGWEHTPKYIQAQFSGVVLCSGNTDVLNGNHLLTQFTPCNWFNYGAVWHIDFFPQ